MPRDIRLIVIHCSATPNGRALSHGSASIATVIDGWHEARGFRREIYWRQQQNPMLSAIGYHTVIDTAGVIATGRHLDEVGAHAAGFNQNSVGICMAGTDAFTPAQWSALKAVVADYRRRWPGARICGHRDFSPDRNGDGRVTSNEWTKTCPGFDVAGWLANGMTPLPRNVFAGA